MGSALKTGVVAGVLVVGTYAAMILGAGVGFVGYNEAKTQIKKQARKLRNKKGGA